MRRIAVLVILAMAMTLSYPALAAVPMLLSYQGQLGDASGAPISTPTAARLTILWGGTSTENPSTGKPVYQEDAVLAPDADGLFHHLIGSGSATSQCDENRDGVANEPCVLTLNDFPSTGAMVFLELRIDPAGVNNLLTPRQPLVSMPYAMNAGTIQGLGPADLVTSVVGGPGLTGGGTGSGVSLAIAFEGVTSAMIAPGAVTAGHLQMDAVTTGNIANHTITSADIAADTITSTEIATNAIGTLEIAADSITSGDIATGGVGSAEIADNSVSSSDIAAETITDVDIATGGVGSAEIADDSIQATDIATGGVGSAEILDGTITSNDIGAGAVMSSDIAAGAVTNSHLAMTLFHSPQICTTSETENALSLGTRNFCALAVVAATHQIDSGTGHWCRLTLSGSIWTLGARSNGTTSVCCEAFCF